MFKKNKYNQVRDVGKRLSEEIPKLYGLEKSLTKIIRLLGIGQGKKVIFQSEEKVKKYYTVTKLKEAVS